MKLQISSRLAIYALLELAGDPDRQLSAADIGAKYGVSTHHLAKVMHTLGRAGLVKSVRGAGGGFAFSGNARRTTLLDVISLFEPVETVRSGDAEPGEQTLEGAALRQLLDEIDENTWATFNSITISTMLKAVPGRN